VDAGWAGDELRFWGLCGARFVVFNYFAIFQPLSPPLLHFLLFSLIFVQSLSSASPCLPVFPGFRWFSSSLHLVRPLSVPASSDLIHMSHHHVSCPGSWFLQWQFAPFLVSRSSSCSRFTSSPTSTFTLSNLENPTYMLLQLPPSVTRLYHSMSSTSPSRHHIFTPSPPSYSLSSPLSDCRLAVVTSFRIFLAFRVQLAITSSVCLALPLASFPLHRLGHFLAVLRLRPLSARLAVIRHLQHHDFRHCRRVHSTVFILFRFPGAC